MKLKTLKSKLRSLTALFMAFLTLFAVMPLNVFASGDIFEPDPNIKPEPFMVRMDGNEVEVSEDGIATVQVEGFDELFELTIPRYFYLDGKRISINDEIVENIAPVASPAIPTDTRQRAVLEALPPIGFIVSVSSDLPNNASVGQIGSNYTHPAYVTMNGNVVSSIRYVVIINGVSYEAFCADPNLPGPENSSAVYELTGEGGAQFRTVLRYGFPINPALTVGDTEDRAWNAYITRVAVAYVSRPNATWGRLTGSTRVAVDNRVAGTGGAAAKASAPAITINDEVNSTAFDDLPQSPSFVLGHNRRTNCQRNPFRFEWTQGTPAGTRLYVDGTHVATAPTNSTTTFTVNPGGFSNASEFHFVMPSSSEGQTASVNLVGINNRYAGRVFVMQNPNNADAWQDIVFYVPEVSASAAYTWNYQPGGDSGRLRIVKTNMQGQPRGGAVFNITGPDPSMPMTITIPTNGWTSAPLMEGVYTITEITPPPGYKLASNNTQTITVTPNHTATAPAIVTFANERRETIITTRTTAVTIQKVDALSRENIPGAMMRLVGMSANYVTLPDGQSISFNNTGIQLMQVLTDGAVASGSEDVISTVRDGVWQIEGLPYGFYMVYEYRAPDGYSLLPAHTARGFWLAPPNVQVEMTPQEVDVSGNANQGSVNVNVTMPGGGGNVSGGGDPEAGWSTDWDLNFNLPIPDFNIVEQPVANAVSIIFENYPFSEIVVYKRAINNGIEGDFLAGAMFRIEGFFVEGNAPQIIDMVGVTDANGRLVFHGLPAGGYTITEVQAPAGFLLDSPNARHVNVSWGQVDGHPTRPAPSVVFFNTPKSSLEIHKVCATTGADLAGAVFEIADPTTGETWQATTNAQGRAIFGRGTLGNFLYPNRTYIVREVVAPQGFVLDSTPREIVLSPGDNNIITWTNYRNPALTIIKVDQDTNERLPGAHFTIQALGGGNPIPTDFVMITDANGEIRIPWTLFPNEAERTFIVTETVPPLGYNLANPNWQQVTLLAGYDNTVVFANRRMPTLTIQKIDARTGYPIQGAWFEVYYLGASQGTGSGNIGTPGLITGNPFITDQNGRIVIEGLHSGRYRIREIRAANNYWLDPLEQNRTWIVEIRDNEDYVLTVENTLLPTLVITKRNAITWRPIPMTQFRVDFEVPNSPNVQHIGHFMTNAQGQIILPFVQSGWYRVQETRPAPGMTLATNNHFRVFLQPGDNSYALIREGVIASESMIIPSPIPTPPASDEPVVDGDEGDREELGGSGSGNNATIPNAPTPDIPADVDVEVKDPDLGAIVDDGLAPEQQNPTNPPSIPDIDWDNIDLENTDINHYDNPNLPTLANGRLEVWGGEVFWDNELDIWNFPQNTLVIRKEDATTGQLLAGARFGLTRVSSGNDSGLHGTVIGEFTTNSSGIIVIAGLDPGFYVIEELIPPTNFTLSANTRQHVFMRPDDTSVVSVTFANLPYGSLLITLRCSVTSAPIPNGEFRVTTSSGAVVGTNNGIFWTNLQGEILIPNVRPDSFVITQVSVPPQFTINLVQSTQTILVNPTGQTYRVDFFSDPPSQLIITLRCEVTGQPLQGGEFRVTNSAGNVVGSSNGIFFTNQQGEITIPNLGVDSYVVTQLNAPDGFRLGHGSGQQNSQTVFVVRPAETYTLNFTNEPFSGLIIQQTDGYNGDRLPGVTFRVEQINHTGNVLVGEFVTDNNGQIEITGLLGSFNVMQLEVPNGFEHDPQPTRIVQVNTGTPTLVTFVAPRTGSLEITLADGDGNPLSGGRFEVRRQNGQFVGEFVTNQSGGISIPNLGSGWYTVEQVAPPQGFVMTDTTRSVEVSTNSVARAQFVNITLPSLVIEKVDTNGNPLAGAEFEIRRLNGELVHRLVTNQGGLITIAHLDPGSYEVIESRAPDGFALVEPSRAIEIVAGETRTERFVNPRLSTLVVQKVHGTTNAPLQGVVFEISTLQGQRIPNPANNSFEFVTNNAGMIRLPNLAAGTYVITETRPLAGFMAVEPLVVTIGHDNEYVFTIRNYPYPDMNILKLDGHTGRPQQGVQFQIHTWFASSGGGGTAGQPVRNPADGSFFFTTDQAGLIRLANLPHGTYVATETRPLTGFRAAEPVIFTVGNHQPATITIRNYRYASWNIQKLDGHTNQPQAGVVFEVAHFFGTGTTGERIRNPQNGSFEFVTDASGIARIGALDRGSYIITEKRPLAGFVAADPIIINVTGDETDTTVTVRNYRQANLSIRKVNSVTRAPLAGVVFEISRPDGTRLINPATGFHDFVTNHNGLIFLPSIADGRYYLRETRALPGFIIDEEVIPFNIDASARQREHVLVVENTPAAGLLIVKTDAQTGRPLAGVEFEVRHADGRLVTGQMLHGNQPDTPANSPQIAPNGNFVTDSRGRINLNHLAPGVYHVVETHALPGFLLDETVHVVTVTAGQQTTLEVVNEQMAGLRIHKIDSVTRQGIQGVEFRIFDFITNQEVAGPLITDNNGIIDFVGILPAGRYTIRETREAPGYLRDTMPRTIELRSGMITELTWENTREAGQIQITKLSSADNQVNGLPAGSRLEGAVFEVRDWRTGNVIDQFVTDARGVGVSRPLPLGRYRVEEIVAPAFYRRSDVVLDITIEHSGQIVGYEFFNEPANVGVEVRKTGPAEVMSGQPIVWNITTIANSSSIELSDFYVRDILPAHAVRLDRIFTGTFNQSLRYSVMFRTNQNDTWRVAYDNLLSTTNNALVMSPAALGLRSNEHVTEIMYSFGTVRAGFRSVDAPRIEGTVRDGLQNGYEFVNRIDIGGRTGTEWVVGNNVWVTRVFRPTHGQHPRTGW